MLVVGGFPRANLSGWGNIDAVGGGGLPLAPGRALPGPPGPAGGGPADLQEALVGDVVVRGEEQLAEDLRKGTRLPVNIDRLQSRGYGSGRDLALHAAAGPRDE